LAKNKQHSFRFFLNKQSSFATLITDMWHQNATHTILLDLPCSSQYIHIGSVTNLAAPQSKYMWDHFRQHLAEDTKHYNTVFSVDINNKLCGSKRETCSNIAILFIYTINLQQNFSTTYKMI
jgi:hypothetical protein